MTAQGLPTGRISRRMALTGLAMVTLGGAGVLSAAPAYAKSTGSSTTTAQPPTRLDFTGVTEKVIVPDGMRAVSVRAAGGSGGAALGGGPLGQGALVTGMLTVTPGQVLTINVGGHGQGHRYATGDGTDEPVGGWNGAGAGGGNGRGRANGHKTSAAGGGATTIQEGLSFLLVAGGGGGAGGSGSDYEAGGRGGNAGTSWQGQAGANGTKSGGGWGGAAGGQTAQAGERGLDRGGAGAGGGGGGGVRGGNGGHAGDGFIGAPGGGGGSGTSDVARSRVTDQHVAPAPLSDSRTPTHGSVSLQWHQVIEQGCVVVPGPVVGKTYTATEGSTAFRAVFSGPCSSPSDPNPPAYQVTVVAGGDGAVAAKSWYYHTPARWFTPWTLGAHETITIPVNTIDIIGLSAGSFTVHSISA